MDNFHLCGFLLYYLIKKKLAYFQWKKLIDRKNRWLIKKLKVFSTFNDCLINKFWLIIRFLYFFSNVHAQIEKPIAKIRSIAWNASIKISLKTPFGAKCGIEDLALLYVFSTPFGVQHLHPVPPHWLNAPSTLKQELICEMTFTVDIFFNWFFLNQ